MLETYVVAFTTIFATVGPLDVAAVFAALTAGTSKAKAKSMAYRGTAIATFILLGFALGGEIILQTLGISMAALKVAGGILLLLIAIDLVFARTSGGFSTTDEENDEASIKQDISVFPLATPLIAGPGAMGAAILLMAKSAEEPSLQAMVIAAILSIMLLTLCLLLIATRVQKVLGITGMQVITRVFGVLLAALAVQFMLDGLVQSQLLAH
ncbi:MAG: antibiotic resistance protein MarC [Bermanella sp.]|jgi:multiple antibiotic resistance protein|nr:antibiotic resistance protein MarC [Bermanella sp.]|tara:strand:- start:58 stop:690 length:633 start_codon:yes stop_codon:yes gene_type:complete